MTEIGWVGAGARQAGRSGAGVVDGRPEPVTGGPPVQLPPGQELASELADQLEELSGCLARMDAVVSMLEADLERRAATWDALIPAIDRHEAGEPAAPPRPTRSDHDGTSSTGRATRQPRPRRRGGRGRRHGRRHGRRR
jgi:hypothetical protein